MAETTTNLTQALTPVGNAPAITPVPSTNPNVLTLNEVPKVNYDDVQMSPVVATSQQARAEVNSANQYLNNQQQAAQQAVVPQTKPQEQTQAQPKADDFKIIESLAADLSDAKLNKKAVKDLSSAERSLAQYQANMKKVQRELESIQRNMDARTSQQIEDIKAEYAEIAEEQRIANQAYERGVFTAGLVSGREQYAPEIQEGLMAQAVSFGIKQLRSIQRERAKLINEAEAARDERNYQLLTAKMDMIRQSYRDELDTTLALKQEFRSAAEFEKNSYEYSAVNLAPYVNQVLTGTDADEDIFYNAAKEAKIPEAVLRRAVDDYQSQQRQALPASVQEFMYLQENGMLPSGVNTYNSYLNWQANIGRSSGGGNKTKPITTQQAANAGLMFLEGVDQDEFIRESTDSKGQWLSDPPSWFRANLEEETQQSLTDSSVNSAWQEFTSNPGANKLRTGVTSQSDDVEELKAALGIIE